MSVAAVGDLIVILQEVHKCRRRQIQGRRSAPSLLKGVTLPLVEISPLRGGNKLLRRAGMIEIIGFGMSGQRHQRAMVEIVIPQCVHSVAASLG